MNVIALISQARPLWPRGGSLFSEGESGGSGPALEGKLDSAPISAGYVAGWAKEADGAAIEAAAEHVAKTSHAIAEALQLTAQ